MLVYTGPRLDRHDPVDVVRHHDRDVIVKESPKSASAATTKPPAVGVEYERLQQITDTFERELDVLVNKITPVLRTVPQQSNANETKSVSEPHGVPLADALYICNARLVRALDRIAAIKDLIEV